VNVLAPGNIFTEDSVWQKRMQEDPKALEAFLSEEVALGRLATPQEIARVAVFLLSPAASFMTGSTVVVDGGQARTW
jgi:3-oxoacyl-[acyl-carrier protein] reductase